MHENHTALITGASAGIGKALARVFAEKGFDVILTARREDRLIELANEIEERFSVRAYVIPEDMADPGAPERLMAEISERGLDVDALINNAGYGVEETFDGTSWQTHVDFMNVLQMSVMHLCYLCLPHMKEQKFGWILNVASLAGYLPGMNTGATLYNPVKAFIIRFTQGLWTENRGTGVHFTALCPGFTHTEFHNVMGSNDNRPSAEFLWMDAETVARQGFDAVMADKPVLINGWLNRFLHLLPRLLPEQLVFGIIDWMAERKAKRAR